MYFPHFIENRNARVFFPGGGGWGQIPPAIYLVNPQVSHRRPCGSLAQVTRVRVRPQLSSRSLELGVRGTCLLSSPGLLRFLRVLPWLLCAFFPTYGLTNSILACTLVQRQVHAQAFTHTRTHSLRLPHAQSAGRITSSPPVAAQHTRRIKKRRHT